MLQVIAYVRHEYSKKKLFFPMSQNLFGDLQFKKKYDSKFDVKLLLIFKYIQHVWNIKFAIPQELFLFRANQP